jgi:hypothetical protein
MINPIKLSYFFYFLIIVAGLAECAEQCIYKKKFKIGQFFDVAKVMIIDRKI